jgi:phosphoribosylaminoimidazole-succinocarboxamide synthase
MFLNATKDIVPNWLLATPDPAVAIGVACEPIRIEMVIRGYLAGHAAREYKAGKRILCGIALPEGLQENDRLPAPIITPATKAEEGHDEDISREDILARGLVPSDIYAQMEQYTHALFERGTQMAAERGLILVDTKYEFGLHNGVVTLIDEIHTPDSSRYFYTDGYEARQASGEAQKQLSKEFVRQWLIENSFQGLEGQQMPSMPDHFVQTISERYIELYERITGLAFEKADTQNIVARIENNVNAYLQNN